MGASCFSLSHSCSVWSPIIFFHPLSPNYQCSLLGVICFSRKGASNSKIHHYVDFYKCTCHHLGTFCCSWGFQFASWNDDRGLYTIYYITCYLFYRMILIFWEDYEVLELLATRFLGYMGITSGPRVRSYDV